MRLINTSTLELEVFDEGRIPLRYAILSHRWTGQEVTFQEYQDLQQRSASNGVLSKSLVESRSGYQKIQNCCRQAKEDGLGWVWIDTVCIDKSSSAELSEAINSMFPWYKGSEVCYAYLEDVQASEDCHIPGSSFRKSRWFTRGWTLQELIAPATVIFYNENWTKIGSKRELESLLTDITGIDELVLSTGMPLSSVSVARKMSWAAKRETTRVEDRAYCLLGIFHINMPLLYGEGQNAFVRLQEEIMKSSDDQSLFMWEYTDDTEAEFGILAKSPAAFLNAADIVPFRNWKTSEPYAMTNKGLRVHIPLFRQPKSRDTSERYGEEVIAVFGCRREASSQRDADPKGSIGIVVEPLVDDGDQFIRTRGEQPRIVPLVFLSGLCKQTIFIRKDNIKPEPADMRWKHHFIIRLSNECAHIYSIRTAYPEEAPLSPAAFVKASESGHAALCFESNYEQFLPFVLVLWNKVPRIGFGADIIAGPQTADWRFVSASDIEVYIKQFRASWRKKFEAQIQREMVLVVAVAPQNIFGEEVFVVNIEALPKDTW